MNKSNIPDSLVEDIAHGRCVAFVGAGFSAAAKLPTWKDLLRGLAETQNLDPAVAAHVKNVMGEDNVTAHELDQAAQLFEDSLGRSVFIDRLRVLLHANPDNREIRARLRYLLNIPFRAIVTTNFDPILNGEVPGPAVYRSILRPGRYRWWERAFWDDKASGAPVVKLHGDLSKKNAEEMVVLTRRDYRRRLYEDAGYITFLRGLLSTNTVLFMGFSFEDAYLNELRSQVLALFDYGKLSQSAGNKTPLAYAILADVPDLVKLHFARHEGIEVLNFDTADGTNFSGFDEYLRALWEETAILPRFGRLVEGKKILWLDSNPKNNDAGFRFLEKAVGTVDDSPGTRIDTVLSVNDAIQSLTSPTPSYNLIISHWGHKGSVDEKGKPQDVTIRLLIQMRNLDIRCPVVVFSSSNEMDARKATCLALGAQAYCYQWEDLFREIFRIL